MKTLNYANLVKRALGLASVVAAGTVVSLPASAQVEPTAQLGAPSIEAQVTPEVEIPDATEIMEEAIPGTEETEATDEVTTEESTEVTTEETTEETAEETLTPEESPVEEAEGEAETAPGAITLDGSETAPDAAVEEIPPVDEAPAIDEAPSIDEAPATETEVPATEAAPEGSKELSKESISQVPTETEVPATEVETPAAETEVPATETEIPATETEVPATETEAPTTEAETPATEAETPELAAASGTIVDVASASENFQTLVSALTEAEMAQILDGEEQYTVFAPTDEAFAALPEGTMEELLKPENREALIQILSYHVIPGTVMSTDLTSGEVATVEGSPVTVAVEADGMVMVNEASVVQADIPATNGVIHAIDQVIIPPSLF